MAADHSTTAVTAPDVPTLSSSTSFGQMQVDNEVVVPVNKKVRVITTANDVIHSWMIPAFGVKQDAIPGFVRDTWFRAEKTGDFYGQCAELCGKEHAYMPIHVKVLSEADYTRWVDGKRKEAAAAADDPTRQWKLDELVARGQKVYATNCSVCHRPDGKGAAPIKPLDGSAVVLDADAAKQIAVLLQGAANGAMPAWKQLSDTELAAYQRTLFGAQVKYHSANKTTREVAFNMFRVKNVFEHRRYFSGKTNNQLRNKSQ